jgi:hypothetical protein
MGFWIRTKNAAKSRAATSWPLMRVRYAAGFRVRSSSWRFAMASSAASMAKTTGSGALG